MCNMLIIDTHPALLVEEKGRLGCVKGCVVGRNPKCSRCPRLPVAGVCGRVCVCGKREGGVAGRGGRWAGRKGSWQKVLVMVCMYNAYTTGAAMGGGRCSGR